MGAAAQEGKHVGGADAGRVERSEAVCRAVEERGVLGQWQRWCSVVAGLWALLPSGISAAVLPGLQRGNGLPVPARKQRFLSFKLRCGRA